MWPFRDNAKDTAMIEEAHLRVDRFTAEKMVLDIEKENLVKRQAEIWSIMNPSAELETEYRRVSLKAAFDLKKIICLQNHIQKMAVARYHCQDGQCKKLEELLKIEDPCANVTTNITDFNGMGPSDSDQSSYVE